MRPRVRVLVLARVVTEVCTVRKPGNKTIALAIIGKLSPGDYREVELQVEVEVFVGDDSRTYLSRDVVFFIFYKIS